MALRQLGRAVASAAERIQDQWSRPGRQFLQQSAKGGTVVGRDRFAMDVVQMPADQGWQFWIQVVVLVADYLAGSSWHGLRCPLLG
jgi:hypothetical protein